MKDSSIMALLPILETLDEKMMLVTDHHSAVLSDLHEQQKLSAENLLHYLALRSEDIRSLQDDLHILGLSSLASSESHIRRQLQSILQLLGKKIPTGELALCNYTHGKQLIHQRSAELFGSKRDQDIPFLMVTFDTGFAENYRLVKELLLSGMNIARINCSHDNEEIWEQMIRFVQRASDETGIPCRIYMDLAGPKMRTIILGKGKFEYKVPLQEGERFYFAEKDSDFQIDEVVVGCSEEGIISQLEPGQRVMFDDGLIESRILEIDSGIAILEVLRCSSKKGILKAEKGINIPDTSLSLPSLTVHDLKNLPFICRHADLIGYSFVRSANDIDVLQKEIDRLSGKGRIILKIETREAVENLPSLLIQGMHESVFGVMIARGDLAVEIGFERMSEIQEEILWICEAAHVPVIWATQVLESLNKSGIATRAEVTDAAYAAMAECVMINKGEHIIQVIETLRDILHRSGSHHIKKRYTFRPMHIAMRYIEMEPVS